MRPSVHAMRIADGQLGPLTRRQLLCVLSRHQIDHFLDAGAISTVFAGVYRTAGSAASFEQRCLAATYAAGDGSFVSHGSSASLRRLLDTSEVIEVTVPKGRRVTRAGIVAHHSSVLDAVDVSFCGPIPVTSPARTLLDVTPRLDDHRLELVSDDAFRRGLVGADQLLAYLARPVLAARPGIGRLRSVATDRLGHGVPQSWLETHMLQLVRAYRLPLPSRQLHVRVMAREVFFDLAYPDQRLAIEPEGWAPHWGRDRWQADHDRYNAVELGDWRVLRFTYSDVTERPAYVAYVIAEKLGLRPTGWREQSRKK